MHVGFVILGGSGRMGGLGLQAITQFQQQQSEHTIELVGVVEVRKEALERLADDLRRFGHRTTQIWSDIDPALIRAAEYHAGVKLGHLERPKLVIYDASPTTFHTDNLRAVVSSEYLDNLIYLGEKPVFLDANDIKTFRKWQDCFFCDFIETTNPVFRATGAYIAEKSLSIKEMWFWRAGDYGLNHFSGAEKERKGVSGGSLFDKAVHDLSISVGWLTPQRIGDFEIDSARIECLQLHSIDPLQVMSVSGTYDPLLSKKQILRAFDPRPNGDSETRLQFPADAMFALDASWKIRGRRDPVPAHYLSSWIGYSGGEIAAEQAFISKLQQLGIEADEWRDERMGVCVPVGSLEPQSRYVRYNVYDEQEARLAIIECQAPNGERMHIVCNFLGGRFALNRTRSAILIRRPQGKRPHREYLYPVSESDHAEEARHYEQRKVTDFISVLQTVIEYCATNVPDPMISHRSALWVHDILIDAQEVGLRSSDFNSLRAKSRRIFREKVKSRRVKPVTN